ncbi:MAG: hypothetical protein J7L15_06670 [Clostridiales bacterium]|nr:hypothetical protein [Clostridiales bacterium]
MEELLKTIKDIAGMHPSKTMEWNELISGIEIEVKAGYINVQTHPEYDHLRVYKYSMAAAIERHWNIFTLIARGLILDIEAREIVACTFPKFFNLGELDPNMSLVENVFEATEKIDGSMGIIVYFDNKWRAATLGSFDSEQARYANEYIKKNIDVSCLLKGDTYLVEIVYPENRIVISYDKEGLFLLSMFDDMGYEYPMPLIKAVAEKAGFFSPKVYNFDSLDKVVNDAKGLDFNHEGYVLRFKSGVRVKVKGDEYCRIHKLISYCTPLAIWELLLNKENTIQVKNDLPEELRKDFNSIVSILEFQLKDFMDEIEDIYEKTKHMDNKELGLKIRDHKQTGYFKNVKTKDAINFLFSRRKDTFFETFENIESFMRRMIFKVVKPSANKLEGYTPSSVVNRFQHPQ